MEIDEDYRNRMQHVVMQAIMTASLHEDVALIKTGEIVDVALNLIAMMCAGSDDMQTPSGRRRGVENISKMLLRKIVAFQEEVEAKGWPAEVFNLNDKDFN